VFVLAVAAVCALAGARSFREAGDLTADLPREALTGLGERPHPLRWVIIARVGSGSGPCCMRWTRPPSTC
jgi:hypothetical protein